MKALAFKFFCLFPLLQHQAKACSSASLLKLRRDGEVTWVSDVPGKSKFAQERIHFFASLFGSLVGEGHHRVSPYPALRAAASGFSRDFFSVAGMGKYDEGGRMAIP